MITGRDLIIYILKNNLEDAQIFENGKLLGFMTIEEAAVKFGYGTGTIKAWVQLNHEVCLKIGDMIFIPIDAEI